MGTTLTNPVSGRTNCALGTKLVIGTLSNTGHGHVMSPEHKQTDKLTAFVYTTFYCCRFHREWLQIVIDDSQRTLHLFAMFMLSLTFKVLSYPYIPKIRNYKIILIHLNGPCYASLLKNKLHIDTHLKIYLHFPFAKLLIFQIYEQNKLVILAFCYFVTNYFIFRL